MDSRILYLIATLVILVFCLKFSDAANENGYIGCFNDNPAINSQKFHSKPMRPNRCRNLCDGYRFFALRKGSECWCGNADYALYGAVPEPECNMTCENGAFCGGYNVSTVYRTVECSDVCLNHSVLCFDSGVNKEITTCVNCQGNTAGATCQNCLPDHYGFPVAGDCQPCNCGSGAINSTCNTNTGQCICKSGFEGLACDTCISEKFVSGSTCLDCECGVGSLSNVCHQITGQCTCKNYFIGRTCSECEEGRFVQAGSCVPCNCGIGANSTSCHQTTGQCFCNPGFGDLTCSTCSPGFRLEGSVCVDLDECALGTHDCSSDATCTNTLGSYTCTCNPGFSGPGNICNDVDECTVPSHNCSSSATCTNFVGGFSCACKSGFSGDGYVCTDIDECAALPKPCDSQATCTNFAGGFTCACPSGLYGNGFTCQPCTCGSGASSSICNSVTGVCPCLPGYATPFCNDCQPGFFGSNCTACPSCVHGTCNDELSGDGQCSCDPGWATPLCNICSPGFYGPNCAGICPSCGEGSCSEGLLGNGTCICEPGWVNNGSSFCSVCQEGYYPSNGQCLPCSSSCKTCSGPASNQCLSCPVSRVLNSGSCTNACPSGRFQDSNLVCQPCHSSCLECTGSSDTDCLSCPSESVRLGTSCVAQCPQNFYNNTGTCLACHSSCASCDGSTQNDCLTCPANFFLNPVRGKCVNVCPDGMFPNSNSVCLTCHTSCLTCNGTSDSSCLTCPPDKIHFEGQCLAACPIGFFQSPTTICQKCECNNHATECHAETGECLNCDGHTTGPNCNLCLSGYTASNTSDGFFCTGQGTNSAANTRNVAIGIGVAVAVLIMALIGIALIIIRSRKVQKIDPVVGSKSDFEDIYGSSLDLEMACSTLRNVAGTDSGAPTLLNTEIGKELSLPGYLKMSYQEDIRIEKTLAGGGGGSIFMGSILNPDMRLKYPSCADRIAIKKIFLHDSLTAEENSQLFHQEVSVMSALSYHPNIAKVLFYTEDPNAIVFPLYESDLHRLIHSPTLVYSPAQMRDILLQISMGMQAIHALEIAHRDLKPANFLLEPNHKAEQDGRFPFTVKITDFGVCHVSHSNVASQKFINVFGVSVKYAAPEVFSRMMLKKFEGDIAELMKSDTFSFAISAWELITRKHPWEGLTGEEIQAKVVAGERPPLPESTHDPLLATLEDLTRLCWNQEHAKRPTFKDVAAKLVRLF